MSVAEELGYSKRDRTFIPQDLSFETFDGLQSLLEHLLNREIKNKEDLQQWLLDVSELKSVLEETSAWAYINMTRYTEDEEKQKWYQHIINEIEPKLKPYMDKLNRKYFDSPFRKQLPSPRFDVFNRKIENRIKLFRPENIELEKEDSQLDNQYTQIVGALTIDFDGKEQTIQQLSRYLEEPDRDLRKKAFEAILNRTLKEKEKITTIFEKMLNLRHKVASNAGFENFRDYMFMELERFDYSPQDCFTLHNNIEKYTLPLIKEMMEERKKRLQLSALKPYDLSVNIYGEKPLRPFKEVRELIDGCITIFSKLDPKLGKELSLMDEMNLLDLDSRKGKAGGGYLYPLEETKLPFIFANAVGMSRDLIVLLHEGGHAVHHFEAQNEPLIEYRSTSMEMAEVASMSMELITMDYWDEFYKDPKDLTRAKINQLEGVISLLPWICTVDAFQHHIYLNPQENTEQRNKKWEEIYLRFHPMVDYQGYEDFLTYRWQRVHHIFGVPFYYIDYAIAQIGALQVWRNYKKDPKQAIKQYLNGLSKGGSLPLPELYEETGIQFDFSDSMISSLMKMVEEELKNLRSQL